MSRASLPQAAHILKLIEYSGWDSEIIQNTLFGKWGLIRDIVGALHQGRVSAETFEAALAAANGHPCRNDLAKKTIVTPATGDLRLDQARTLFDKGWGEAVKVGSFEEYLASVPEIPEHLLASDERFPHLILVDRRPGITAMCRMSGLNYDGNDSTFVPFDPDKAIKEPTYWIQANHGWQNRNRKPFNCRNAFAKAGDEVGLEAHEGVAVYALVEEVRRLVNEGRHYLDLPGSVYVDFRGRAACLGNWHAEPELGWDGDDGAVPDYGSASRRECKV